LLFLPYLNSAGSPYWNTEARAAFLGIAQNHDRAAFARAVLEGVAFEVRDNLELMTEHGMRPNMIRISGGATRSPLWTQIQADVYGMPVQLLEETEASALGAAMLGGVGTGVFSSVAEAESAMVRSPILVGTKTMVRRMQHMSMPIMHLPAQPLAGSHGLVFILKGNEISTNSCLWWRQGRP